MPPPPPDPFGSRITKLVVNATLLVTAAIGVVAFALKLRWPDGRFVVVTADNRFHCCRLVFEFNPSRIFIFRPWNLRLAVDASWDWSQKSLIDQQDGADTGIEILAIDLSPDERTLSIWSRDPFDTAVELVRADSGMPRLPHVTDNVFRAANLPKRYRSTDAIVPPALVAAQAVYDAAVADPANGLTPLTLTADMTEDGGEFLDRPSWTAAGDWQVPGTLALTTASPLGDQVDSQAYWVVFAAASGWARAAFGFGASPFAGPRPVSTVTLNAGVLEVPYWQIRLPAGFAPIRFVSGPWR